jgi:hypothetical protein
MPFSTASQGRHPSHRATVLARLLIVLFALIHGWGAYASVISSSHDPVAWSEPASALADANSPHHGHSHDDIGTDDGGSEGLNGHNAADHSHDKPNLPRSGAQAAIASADDWNPTGQVPLRPAPYFAFDRPPKPLPLH